MRSLVTPTASRRFVARCIRLHIAVLLPALLLAVMVTLAGANATASRSERPVPTLENIATDPADLSEYLAYWKAKSYARAIANYRPATLNQLAYDVRTYDLDLHPNITTHVLSGTVRMIATVVAGPITTVDLDLDNVNMVCDAATSAGAATTFAQGGGVLTVQLGRAYNNGENVDVTVQYHGTPSGGGFGASFGFDVHNQYTLVSSLSEPFDARTWWPCKDDPSDKADSVDIRMTMPTGYITASEGRLITSTDDGTTAYRHWHERHPISTYLVSVASFPYTVITDWYRPTPTDSMLIRFHLFPETVAPTAVVHAKVKDMIAAYVPKYGPYPFYDEKYGHAQFLWGGGMEHQTCTSLGAFGEYTIAHELGHQWWGDAVTCRDFHHIWLNEGFATFTEAIWAEAMGGIGAFHTRMNAYSYLGAGTIYCPDLSDVNRIFSSNLSYKKPAWVLAMLRHIMGEANFFLAMRTYLQQHYYGTAVTEEFQATCEQISGMNLTKFFQEWIYGEYYPQYRINSAWVPGSGGGFDVSVQIQQTQSWQIFWMPVDVRINTPSGSYTFVAQDSMPVQLFEFNVPFQPTSVTLDPDQWVLKTVTPVTGVESGRAAGLELAVPHPNPTRGECAIGYTTPRDGQVDVDVVDASGRRVARLQHGAVAAGEHRIQWSGRDDGGRVLGPGIYWVMLGFQGQRLSRRLALLN